MPAATVEAIAEAVTKEDSALAPVGGISVGMLLHAITRLYFSDDPANEADPVLNTIDEPSRRQTLIAVREDNHDLPTYRFDIHLQGEKETVFFEP